MSCSKLVSVAALAALACASAAAADEPAKAPARAGVKVHMDPATGTVLDEPPATPEAQAAAVDQATKFEKPDYNRTTMATNSRGAVLMNLNGQVRMYSVATVKPSGDIEETCITGSELAHREAEKTEAKAK